MKLSEAGKILQVAPGTVRYYCNTGQLECCRTPGGQRYITEEQLNAFLIKIGREPLEASEEKTAFYIRSSSGSAKLMQAQINELTQEFGEPDKIYRDRASGLNENRPGLKQLITALSKGKYNRVCITYQDRLTRFGFSYLKYIINQHGATLEVLHPNKKYSVEQELMQDFMSLIASFSGKFYRLRGFKQQRELIDRASKEIDKKEKKQHGKEKEEK